MISAQHSLCQDEWLTKAPVRPRCMTAFILRRAPQSAVDTVNNLNFKIKFLLPDPSIYSSSRVVSFSPVDKEGDRCLLFVKCSCFSK